MGTVTIPQEDIQKVHDQGKLDSWYLLEMPTEESNETTISSIHIRLYTNTQTDDESNLGKHLFDLVDFHQSLKCYPYADVVPEFPDLERGDAVIPFSAIKFIQEIPPPKMYISNSQFAK